MRKPFIIILLSVAAPLLSPTTAKADPITIIIKTAVKKVLRAMDLAVQRLQNQTIRLQNAQKALENLLSKLKLEEISEWGQKQRDLFAGYYDELNRVRTAITYYKRVRAIIESQVQLAKEYRHAVQVLSAASCFRPAEITHMLNVYSGMLDHSIRHVDQITHVLTSFSLQMSDADRLDLIHKADQDIQRTLSHLRHFTNENVMLGAQRIKDQSELQTLKALYNLEP